MDISPHLPAFADRYASGKAQIVSVKLAADLETPVSVYLKLTGGADVGFLLESVEGGANRGRYSFIGIRPDLFWRANGDQAETAMDLKAGFQKAGTDIFTSFRDTLAECQIDLPPDAPPILAGLVGYMGYDMVRQMERLPAAKPDPLGVPDALFMRPTVIAIFDSVEDSLTILTPVWHKTEITAEDAYGHAAARIEAVRSALDSPLPRRGKPVIPERFAEPRSNTPRADYLRMVARAKDYIAAGDIFQVVLSQRFTVPFPLPSFALYRSLRRTNPSPYMFYLNFGNFAVAGSSPEILVRLNDGKVTVRPIAGTRRRGANFDEDRKNAEDLLADPKELAEHLMLVDLGRNDVGRVAIKGSVEVTARNIIEYYSHVMHIVSNVTGDIAPGFDGVDAFKAGFPAGTVSGAPKIRAMEIIDELEADKRGIYAGGVGYFASGGGSDTCIALRTGIIKDGMLHIQAGAGIVADSDPDSEYQECRHKAQALVKAAKNAFRYID